MAEQKADQEKQVTSEGAVEIDEEKLDQAAGGMSSGGDLPTESVSFYYSRLEMDYVKPTAPSDPTISRPTITEKKI